MAIEQKERYIVLMEDGSSRSVVASSYQEVIMMLGEENIVKIEKLDYKEIK